MPVTPPNPYEIRRARLRRLKAAVTEYATKEKLRITNEVATLNAVLSGRRAGAGAAQDGPAELSKAAASSLRDYLYVVGNEVAPVVPPIETGDAPSAPAAPTPEKPSSPTNYGSRKRTRISLVILHVTQGSASGAALWFANPAAKASAHYIVAKTGVVVSCVPEAMCAYHCGNSAYNRKSVGVEFEGFVTDSPVLTSIQIDAGVTLVKGICQRYGIIPGPMTVLGHNMVPDPNNPGRTGGLGHHTDPGANFPWATFMSQLATTSVA